MLFWMIKIIFYLPLLIVYPVRVVGRKNVPKNGRIIVSGNHQTVNDPIILALRIHRKMFYMAKAPLFKNKLFGWFLRKMGAYPVETSKSDLTAVKTTLKLLKRDKAVCIFPEGARLKTNEENALKNGAAMFALKTNSPVVPVYFVKKTNAFSFNKLIIGEPIYFSENDGFNSKPDKEMLDKASKLIAKHIHALKPKKKN